MNTLSKRLNARMTRIAEDADTGFTLVELLITVVIIAILTAIAIPAYISVVSASQVSAAKQTISSVFGAEDLYYAGSGDATFNLTRTDALGLFGSATNIGPTAAKLITLDATTVVTLNAAQTFVAVGEISADGTGWVASAKNRTPVLAPAVGTAVGAAAKQTALTNAVAAVVTAG